MSGQAIEKEEVEAVVMMRGWLPWEESNGNRITATLCHLPQTSYRDSLLEAAALEKAVLLPHLLTFSCLISFSCEECERTEDQGGGGGKWLVRWPAGGKAHNAGHPLPTHLMLATSNSPSFMDDHSWEQISANHTHSFLLLTKREGFYFPL